MGKYRRIKFSEALKQARKEKELTQAELAEKAHIHPMSIRRYELGESFPDIGILGSICFALDDDSLLESWAYTNAMNNGEDPSINPDGWNYSFKQVKEIAYQRYWGNIVKNGTWAFQNKLVDVAKFFQNLNEQGIKKSMEMIEVISKVPEYQTDMEWAYRTDSPKEESKE